MQDKEKEKYYEEQDRDLQRYFNEINEIPLLTREEEICLASEIKEGRIDALRKLVEANLRFVVTVAKAYQDRGLPLSDLIMEGNLGLIEAAKRYDAERGIKFISYAVWWIKQSILKALAKHSRTVRMPLSQVWNFQKISKTFGELEQTIGREPTLEEVAKELNSTPTEVSQTIGKWRREVFLEEAIERTDDELRLMSSLATQAALAIENTRLFEESNRQRQLAET
ncbi:MAG: sigma-70 family RNA polymerase sigma factor, partial [candidate division KSB1 bacterium]|nr:sigma-70 family RNA polymerase sigma factor [candidate division KSB1 bacterium]